VIAVPRAAAVAVRWGVLAAVVVVSARLADDAGLPTPYLFAAFAVGIAHALLTRVALAPSNLLSLLAQGTIGWTAGTYFHRSTLDTVGAHGLSIFAFCILTIALSIGAGLLLARIAPVDQATSSFGMIAGGAAGIISISHEFGADERLVAVLQYVRLLIIVVSTPLAATVVFGISRKPVGAAHIDHSASSIAAFLVVGLCVAIPLARRARFPAAAIIGPMIAAALLSLTFGGLTTPLSPNFMNIALAIIGLDVGLRFTPSIVREASALLPKAVAIIVAMIAISALLGVVLASLAHMSELDGYLATTPGGLSAVIALAIGSNSNIGFIISVQVLRTFLMLLMAPPLARWLGARAAAQ
jgi:membrane AbrB-like protein